MLFTGLQKFNRARFSPFRRVATLQEELDHLFQQAFAQPRESAVSAAFDGSSAPLAVYENKDGLTVQVEIPGLKKEDITISLENEVLSVSGERKEAKAPAENASVCRCERAASGRFERKLTLPYRVEAGGIKATYANGVLSIQLPKAEEAKPKQIAVELN